MERDSRGDTEPACRELAEPVILSSEALAWEDGLRERLSARGGSGRFNSGAFGPVATPPEPTRSGSGRLGGRLVVLLALSTPICYLLPHETAHSGRSQRVRAHAA